MCGPCYRALSVCVQAMLQLLLASLLMCVFCSCCLQDCLSACDDNTLCAGVVIRQASNSANTPKTCVLIFGDTTIGVFKRSMTRADTSRQTIPL